jgi:RNA polymerase sigma factor (sigma-70 family)
MEPEQRALRGAGAGSLRRSSLLSSVSLFLRARAGETTALNGLMRRFLPRMRHWARGKLPTWARRRVDTDDLVQDAFVNLQRHLTHIEPRHRDAIGAYLRQSIRNRIRDEVRRGERVEVGGVPVSGWRDAGPLPDAGAEESEQRERYRRGLAQLGERDRELIVGRLELGYSYEQLALAVKAASPDAARVAVRRALLRLADAVANG